MASVDLQLRTAPFDAIAQTYDQVFTESVVGQAQRSAVWVELEEAFHPGDRVLDIGCGTGVDACFLAERGITVLGCDASPVMIQVARKRVCERAKYFGNASVELGTSPAEQIATFAPEGAFDGAFSNFGVLNCIEDLRSFARQLATRLRPGAKVLLCLMGSCCVWEVAWFLAHGHTRRALRRFRGRDTAEFRDGSSVQVYYPGVRNLAQRFAPQFRVRSIKGIGICVPPSYASSSIARYPRIVNLAERSDRLIARFPGFRVLGDHVLVTLQRVTS